MDHAHPAPGASVFPLACALACVGACHSAGGGEPEGPSFAREVAPLLRRECLRCHSGDRPKGDLDLTRRAGLLAGGGSGSPAVVPGKPEESLLFTHVRGGRMPPRKTLSATDRDTLRAWIAAGAPWEGPALEAPITADARKAGADWWSLQPVRRPKVPEVLDDGWVRTPIDAFVLARLEAEGLRPRPEADRATLLRRLTIDLTGLLPTPEEVDAFVADPSPDAYEKVVDRLLASPAYGERWARHWLDVARFAESHGYEMNTLRPNAWPYRDYVIRAFNEDIPYPQFVREQLAGDAAGADPLARAATGFLVGGPHDMVGNATPEGMAQQRADDLADMVGTTGAVFLGLTVGCARCHDHKFDPITQRDFYGIEAVFGGVRHAERALPRTDPEAARAEAKALRARLADLEARLAGAEPLAGPPGTTPRRPPVNARRNVERFRPAEGRSLRFSITATTDGIEPCIDELEVFGPADARDNLALAEKGVKPSASSVYAGNPKHKLEHLNDGRWGNGRSWIAAERGKGWVRLDFPEPVTIDRVVWGRDRERRYQDRLARDYKVEVSPDGERWQAVAGSWDRLPSGSPASATSGGLEAERGALEARLAELEQPWQVYAGAFEKPGPTHLLKRGDPMQKGEEVGPAALGMVAGPAFKPLNPGAPEPDRRLALARWLNDPANPLTARVLVNRLWHWHFGQGIVRTPSDFGFNGDRPSHPELLDWLAAEFLASGGRLKPLHRLLVLSSAYRQAGTFSVPEARADADNRLLWRFTPRRAEAEVLRDAMLQVSGALNRRMGGPGYHLWKYSGYVIVFEPRDDLGAEEFRRMVYQFKPRLQQDRVFGAFDCPDATQMTPRRTTSTTPLQALNLLNSGLVIDQSERFARQVRGKVGADTDAQVRRAFRLALGRVPSQREADAGRALIREHGLAPLCRALFNANEFVFVE